MPTEEKIKLYNELNPTGKKFPANKKPDEKPEDMEWLENKLAEFGAFNEAKDEEPVEAPKVEAPKVKVQTSSDLKVYTVAELLRMSYDHHAEVMREVEEGRAKVIK